MSAALMVMLVVAGFVAPLGTALASAVVHADAPRPAATPADAVRPAAAGYLCESCRLHPAVRVVVVGGASFLVCEGCVFPEVQS